MILHVILFLFIDIMFHIQSVVFWWGIIAFVSNQSQLVKVVQDNTGGHNNNMMDMMREQEKNMENIYEDGIDETMT